MNLQLLLKSKWFHLTRQGVKTEDYRDITPYWFNRLCVGINNVDGKSKNAYYILYNYLNKGWFEEVRKQVKFKDFSINTMTLGYPKSNDLSRILKLEHKGIEIRTGKVEWGAEPGKLYFVIMHGQSVLN